MERDITLNCYKFFEKPELKRVADFFGIACTGNVKELILTPLEIGNALKIFSPDKYVWLFDYGCICLVNFDPPETYRFINYLEATCGIDYNLFSIYNETHLLKTAESHENSLPVISIYAAILGKSTELKFLEHTVNRLFDQSEKFINELHKGLFNSDSSLLKKMTISMMRHQLKVLNSLRILDRPAKCNFKLELRQLYDTIADEYELDKRFMILQKKFNDLHGIMEPYQKLNHSEKEKRLTIMEIFLLALFPLPHLLKFLIPKILTFFWRL